MLKNLESALITSKSRNPLSWRISGHLALRGFLPLDGGCWKGSPRKMFRSRIFLKIRACRIMPSESARIILPFPKSSTVKVNGPCLLSIWKCTIRSNSCWWKSSMKPFRRYFRRAIQNAGGLWGFLNLYEVKCKRLPDSIRRRNAGWRGWWSFRIKVFSLIW